MTQLFVWLALGAALFVSFIVVALRNRFLRARGDESLGTSIQAADLRGLQFDNIDALVGKRDYELLSSVPELTSLARQFRSERRQIVLDWLKALRGDMSALWSFRRILVRRGASAGPAEEIQIAVQFLRAAFLLELLRASVVLLGPFALVRFLGGTRRQVERAQQHCALLLKRLPASSWPVLENR